MDDSGPRSPRHGIAGLGHLGTKSMVRGGLRCKDAPHASTPTPRWKDHAKKWSRVWLVALSRRVRRPMVRHESADGGPWSVHASHLPFGLHTSEATLTGMRHRRRDPRRYAAPDRLRGR